MVARGLCLLFLGRVSCWDTVQLNLFDLVEEVDRNFYELMGMEQGAATPEVRRAYTGWQIILIVLGELFFGCGSPTGCIMHRRFVCN